MTLLRADLEATTLASVADPGGVFWPGQVEAWIARRQGTAFRPIGTPVIATVPSVATVYLEAARPLSAAELGILVRQWSGSGSWAVDVHDVAVVSAMASEQADRERIDWKARTGGALADLAGQAGKFLTLGAVIVLGLVALQALDKAGGTKSW